MKTGLCLQIVALFFLCAAAFAETTGKPSGKVANPPKEVTPASDSVARELSGKAAQKGDSSLVAAAKKSSRNRNRQKLTIDATAVKKSRSRLTVPAAGHAVASAPASADAGAKLDVQIATWKANVGRNREKIEELTREISTLEEVSSRFEEDFYNEDDPASREVLEQKYNHSVERLKAAREELSAAQEEAAKLAQEKPHL